MSRTQQGTKAKSSSPSTTTDSNRITADVGVKVFYDQYEQDNCFSSFKIFRNQYRAAMTDLLQTILDEVVFTGSEWHLPGNLGILRIKKHKPQFRVTKDNVVDTRNQAVDYGATKKLWASNPKAAEKRTLIYHTNDHTHGFRMCFWWDKRASRIRNQSAYFFRATRTNKRTLAAMIKMDDGTIDFYY